MILAAHSSIQDFRSSKSFINNLACSLSCLAFSIVNLVNTTFRRCTYSALPIAAFFAVARLISAVWYVLSVSRDFSSGSAAGFRLSRRFSLLQLEHLLESFYFFHVLQLVLYNVVHNHIFLGVPDQCAKSNHQASLWFVCFHSTHVQGGVF